MQGEMEHATPDFPEGTVGTTVPITEIRNIPSYRGTSLYHGTVGMVPACTVGTVGRTVVPWYQQVLVGRVLVSRLPGIRLR